MIYVYVNQGVVIGVSNSSNDIFDNGSGVLSTCIEMDEPNFNGSSIVMSDGAHVADANQFLEYLQGKI